MTTASSALLGPIELGRVEPDPSWLLPTPPHPPTFPPGTLVNKRTGYRFPGVVLGTVFTYAGKERVIVECIVPEVAGMLHLFSADQLVRSHER